MEDILERLYDGELDPCYRHRDAMGKAGEAYRKAHRAYEAFLQKLPDELKEEYEAFIDKQLDCYPLEMEQVFVEGFRTGVRIMVEMYGGGEG